MKLVPMFAYQGGKSKIAGKICDIILNENKQNFNFVDVCCGGGSVSIEMINKGLHPERIHMFDSGAIGAFWQQVSESSFNVEDFEQLVDSTPKDPALIPGYMQELSKVTFDYVGEVVHVYLLLQAASFGGKQIFDEGCKFSNTSFRSYWKPTETSSRRSPVNPMMPMPETLLKRVKSIVNEMQPIKACHTFAEYIEFKSIENPVVYIDLTYKGTTGYKDTIDMDVVVNNAKSAGAVVYVSEYRPLSDTFWVLSRTEKGGISGNRSGKMVEYLSKL